MQYRFYREFFRAVTNPVRFGIIERLRRQPASVGELSEGLGLEQSHLSHALACLTQCGFVRKVAEGKQRIYSISPEIEDILAKIERQLDRYGRQLEQCEVLAAERQPKVIIGLARQEPRAALARARHTPRRDARNLRAEQRLARDPAPGERP